MFKKKISILGGGTLPSNLRKIGLNMNAIEKKVHLPNAQAILQSHSPPQVALTNFNFSNPGGGEVHLQVDLQNFTPFLK